MPLEAGDGYISGLVATNPVGATDPKSQGDDHLRLIKAAVKNTFPNLTGAVTPTQLELNLLDGLTAVTGSGSLVASASPALTGTVTTEALTASGLIKATASPGLEIEHITPAMVFDETDGAANERQWRFHMSGGIFRLRTADDAGTNPVDVMLFDRSGTTCTEVELNATALDFNATLDLSGAAVLNSTLAVTGAATLSSTLAIAGITTAAEDVKIVQAAGDPRFHIDDGTLTVSFQIDSANDWAHIGTHSAHAFRIFTNNVHRLKIDSSGNFDFMGGTVTTDGNNAAEVGTRGNPPVTKTADYSIATTDAGKLIIATSACDQITFTSGCLAAGMSVVIANGLGTTLSLVQSGVNLYLTGTGAAANRTVSVNGLATVLCTDGATTFLVQGPRVS